MGFFRKDPSAELLVAMDLHSVERMTAVLDASLDVHALIRGKTPVTWRLEMYSRSDAFPACLGLLLDRGGELDDPVVASVLLNGTAAAGRSGFDRLNPDRH